MHFLPLLTDLLEMHNLPYEAHITTEIMHGYSIAKDICQSQPNCMGIIGIGGDGTFQEIAAGMVAAHDKTQKIPTPLGIFAAGSGNDFVMTVEGGKAAAIAKFKKSDMKTATQNFFEAVHQRRTRAVDVITANDVAYLNIGNVGLDARIVHNAVDYKPKYGRYAYLAAVYKSIAQHKNLPLVIEANGKKLDRKYTLVAVCNGQYYGGGLRISPEAKIDDGKITVALCEALSRPKTMVIFPSLMIEQHTRLKAVSFMECEELTITMPKGETLCLDGNLYTNYTVSPFQCDETPNSAEAKIRFKILPQILDVFV